MTQPTTTTIEPAEKREPEPAYRLPGQNRTEQDVVNALRRFPDAISVAATCPRCGLIGFVDLDETAMLLRGDRRFRRIRRAAVTDDAGRVTTPEWVAVFHRRCGTPVRFLK